MYPRSKVAEDNLQLPTEGLEVEEACDDDTMRRFMREWRRRVTRQLASEQRPGPVRGPDRVRPTAH